MMGLVFGEGRRRRHIVESLRRLGPSTATDVSKDTGIGTALLYPTLMAMEDAKTVSSRWDDPEGPTPRRRLYEIDGDAEIAA